MHDDLAIRVSLEVSGVLKRLAKSAVVVNLSVDGEDEALVIVGHGLSSRVCSRTSEPS